MKLSEIFKKRQQPNTTPSHPLIRASEEKLAGREEFINSLDQNLRFLEIGPYFTPTITGENVRYFDVFTTEELRAKAEIDDYDFVKPENVPEMHYTHPDGVLTDIEERFDAAFTSHVIEHQPDLIRHLNEVHDLLVPGGKYYLLAPDKRYCFDHFRPLSTIGEIVQAAQENRVRHSVKTIVDHFALHTHNEIDRHWSGDHIMVGQSQALEARVSSALQCIEDANGKYIDAHAWQFIPQSFAEIVDTLFKGGFTRLKPVVVYDTPDQRHEFTAIFERPI